jgi:hypothetical protein
VLVHRHVALLHALEEAGLRLRGGPVDLVDEHHVREHRARPELEAVLALIEDVRADHVRGKQVGRALHARVLGLDGARQGACQRRLADAGIVLDQHVALRDERHDHVAQRLLRSLDRLSDVTPEAGPQLGYRGRIEIREGRHPVPY